MSRHPSLLYQALERLDSLRAFGVSRHALKAEQRAALRAQGLPTAWSHSTGRIHSFGTAETYKHQVLTYCAWARAEAGVRHVEELDRRAPELARTWLERQIADGRSPYTVQMSRSALRLFHQDRTLGAEVAIPRRRREAIRRSRLPVPSDRRVSLRRHQALIDFLRATGLRRREAAALRVGDVEIHESDACVRVRNGKGGQERLALVLPGAEGILPELLADRSPEELLFPRIPGALDVHACRRAYAQALYEAVSGRELPDPRGRLQPGSYDPESVEIVSWALGHRRLDVVLRHYLR